MGPFTSGAAREITDPQAEVERLATARKRWMPAVVCHDIRQFEHDGRVYFLDIKITAELTGDEPKPLFPVRADLAARIADMIRADCAEASG
jgi:hypothetical protein